jgi:hypothetical protein
MSLTRDYYFGTQSSLNLQQVVFSQNQNVPELRNK